MAFGTRVLKKLKKRKLKPVGQLKGKRMKPVGQGIIKTGTRTPKLKRLPKLDLGPVRKRTPKKIDTTKLKGKKLKPLNTKPIKRRKRSGRTRVT